MKKSWFVLDRRLAYMTIAVVAGVFVVVAFVQGATTISTSITTGGAINASTTLQVTGAVTTWGDLTFGDTVADSVTANAYFTQLRIGTGATFDQIGDVGADELGVEGDAEIDGTLSIGTAASTTALRVGDDRVSTINGMVFGFCSFADVTSFTASTTKYVDCTGATGLTNSYRVLVQATSSFESSFVIQAASSSATAGTVHLRVLNTDMDSNNGNTTLNGTSVNFWAVR
ncbi:MAG: hypothetical protein UY63_C0017G0015 [Parcubacteria group bacterium GW2011_GWA2_51_10]|nr:MAG: hypothetical protein UY63_C0017G0015 [Parcubacteria group bacterium GW2011_GWA2_51_10]